MERKSAKIQKKLVSDIRDNLKRFILNKGLIEGGKVTIPRIDIPRFRYEITGGVSQGEGDIGKALEPKDPISQEGMIETDITINEVAEMLAEEIGLPFQRQREKVILLIQKNMVIREFRKKGE